MYLTLKCLFLLLFLSITSVSEDPYKYSQYILTGKLFCDCEPREYLVGEIELVRSQSLELAAVKRISFP